MKHIDATRDSAHIVSLEPAFDGVVVEPTTTALFESWMRQPLEHIIASARALATAHDVHISEMVLSGFQPPDDDGREIVLTCWVRAADNAADAFWDDLAEIAYQANTASAHGTDEDVRLAVSVRWDG